MTEYEFRVRPYQRPFHEALVQQKKKRLIEVAHRRWGKDEIVLNGFRELSQKRPGTYWHCFPEYAQARKAIWNGINSHTGKRRIFEAYPPEIISRMNDNDMFIETVWGSTWQLIGSDRYDATVGSGPVGIAYSEWALCNPSAWAYHKPMIEESGGTAAFITTPRGRNHVKTMFDRAVTSDLWFAELSNIHSTGALTPEQLKESLQEYIDIYGDDVGNSMFEQEYLCSFNAAILGAFYAREMVQVRREGRIRPVIALPRQPVHTAWDIGVRDDTSIWWFQVYGGRVHILDCYTQSGVGVDHYAEICEQKAKEKRWTRGIDYVPQDAKVTEWGTGKTRVETMQELGLKPQVIPLATKLDGINAVRRMLPFCVFDPACEEAGLPALEQYRREWDDVKKTFKASEVHDWASHPSDAFRYLAMAWREVPVAEVEDKPLPLAGSVLLAGPPVAPTKSRIII